MPSDGFFAISFDSLFKWGITITIIFKLLYLIWLSLSVNSSYCFMLNMRSCRLAWIWWACHILANLPLYWGQWHIFQEDQTVLFICFLFQLPSLYCTSFPLWLCIFVLLKDIVQYGYLLQMKLQDFWSSLSLSAIVFLPPWTFRFPW